MHYRRAHFRILARLPQSEGGIQDRMLSTPHEPALVRLTGVSKAFGSITAVHPLDLQIAAGDFLAILGPSGCGKTTLLNIIAGFVIPDTGHIEISGKDITKLPPERRPTNIVVQGYGLFPHMTVQQNIAYGLKIRKTPAGEIKNRVNEVVELVRLGGLEHRPVTQLSGGQAQRVALARALIMRPEVLLLDEPLAALDLQLRRTMQEELRRIHHSIGGTFVFVTHDQEEAMRLANRIAVMREGRIIQEGSAEEVYFHPRTKFVSTFIGEANVLPGRRSANSVMLEIGVNFPSSGKDGPVVSVVRPDAIRLELDSVDTSPRDDLRVEGIIEDIIFLGTTAVFKVRVHTQLLTVQTSDMRLRYKFAAGQNVMLVWLAKNQVVLADE